MLIRKHLVYVDEKSIRSIKHRVGEVKEDPVLEEAKRKGEEIVESAKKEAEKIIVEAKREANEIVESAKAEAMKIIEDAKRRYESEIRSYMEMKENLSKLMGSIDERIDQVVEELADSVLPILSIVVRKILLKEIDEDLALRRLRNAFGKVMASKKVRVKVNPEDLKLVEEEAKMHGYEVVPDPNVERGDVIVETELGILDMTTSHGLRIIEDIIDEVI